MIKPISATLEITSKCNLECKYCFAESGIKNAREIPYETVIQIVDGLISIGTEHFLIMGGEPTLHRDFLKIIKYLKEKNVTVGFSTNGLMLSDQICKELASLDVKHNVYVSVDTADQVIYQKITGRDCFYRVISGINNLKNNGIRFAISCVVVQQNIESLNEMHEFACQCGASFLNLIRFNVEGRGVISKVEMGVKLEDFTQACDRLISKYGGFRGFWAENCIVSTYTPHPMNFPKDEDLRQFLTIRSDGNMLLGRASGGLVIGNIFKNTVPDIWCSDIANKYFSMSADAFNGLILNNIKIQNQELL